MKKVKHYEVTSLTVPKGCRELSDEEMFKVNGGAEEKKESQESTGESVTVKSGETLGGIVGDYNKANGTNYTVAEVAKNSGISNPDVIQPGQKINFGTSNSTSNGSSSQTGNQGATNTNGTYSTNSGPSTSPSSVNKSSTPSSSPSSLSQYSSVSPSSIANNASPKYESSTYKEKVERYKAQAAGNGINGTNAKGQAITYQQMNEQKIIGQGTSSKSNNIEKDIAYFHFEGRDAKNVITESFLDICKSACTKNGDWRFLSPAMSKYHQNGIGDPELKFICKDGREAVFTKDFSSTGSYELYTDPKYKGTYNYCNVTSSPIGHFIADMVPYYLTGCRNERNQ